MKRVLRIAVVLSAAMAVMLPQPASANVAAGGTGGATVNPGFGQTSTVTATVNMTGRWDNVTGTNTCSFSGAETPVTPGDPRAGLGATTANCFGIKKVVCTFIWTRVGAVAVLSGPTMLGLGCTIGADPTLHDASGTLVLVSTQRAAVPYDVVGSLAVAKRMTAD